jgi:hypothetical protein
LAYCIPAGAERQTQTAPEHDPLDYSLPVRIIEQPGLTEGEKSRQLEDLAAQEAMVSETRKMVRFTMWQLILAVIGAAAVIATLKLNADAVRAAGHANATTANALEHERSKSRAELRPYVGINRVDIDFEKSNVSICFENYGQTPAKEVRVFASVLSSEPNERLIEAGFTERENDLFLLNRTHRPVYSKFYLCQNQRIETDVHFDELSVPRGRNVYVFGRIYYKDWDGSSWRLKFCSLLESGSSVLIPHECYNGEDDHQHIDDIASETMSAWPRVTI